MPNNHFRFDNLLLAFEYAGVLKILMDDGTELECKPGDVSMLLSGHDAWVVGSQPVVVVDGHGMTEYGAKK